MRKTILAVTAALALGLSSGVMAAEYSGSLIQGSSAYAGTISGATTTETGFAGTYGIANMRAGTTGELRTGSNRAFVNGTTFVTGHSESGTLVEGAGMAGSIAGGKADANVLGEAYFDGNRKGGEAEISAGSTGKSWAATGSIGEGEGISVQGFDAYGDAKAKAKITKDGGEYTTTTNALTSSGAISYTVEEGNAIGKTHTVGWGFAGADAYRTHGDADDDGTCVANGGTGNCGINGNGTGNEGGGQGPS